jgi:hypothetical protein
VIGRLHYEMIRGLLHEGSCPGNGELARALGLSIPRLEALLKEAAEGHALVLHPHVPEPWVVHPFSLTPTLNWVEGPGHGWWAPCIWCAFGVATLAGGRTFIHTRIGAERESVVVPVKDGEPETAHDLCVHFAIPPSHAWDNVHRHCALVLPFRGVDDIAPWCVRHRQPRGEAVPLQQVAQLARLWYGKHADPDWKKWSVAEAQDIFARAGLTSAFWDLGERRGRY